MSFDEFDVYPTYFGGDGGLLPALVNSVSDARGSGVTKERNTVVFVENVAIAAELYCGWQTTARLGNLWKPWKCPAELLPRWERILKLPPDPSLSEYERRSRWATLWGRFGRMPEWGFYAETANRTAQSAFVQFETIDQTIATIHVPDGSYPWGTVATGSPWSSTSYHILALVEKPANYTEAQFYDLMNRFTEAMHPILSSFHTFDWYRAPEGYPAISVAGGPSAAGFYLDAEHNLDNNVFDV